MVVVVGGGGGREVGRCQSESPFTCSTLIHPTDMIVGTYNKLP